MKIICIGRNYLNHIKELNNDIPTELVVFMKPDSALLKSGKTFYIPDFSQEVHHELELVVKINRLGKNIAEKFAHRYYEEIGLGIDFTARDLQRKLMDNSLPWEKAKGFDHSAALGKFVQKDKFQDLQNLNLELKINGETRQSGNTKDMIFTIDKIISEVSKYFTLKIGDLIYTGTPMGVGPVKINDHLTATLEGEELINFLVK